MDDFQAMLLYESEAVSVPYFWEKFDKENYTIWYCEYKYPDELTQVFMSCNLISGMFQRLDKMRKHAFASMILFGEDNKSSISGIWVWRGHELAFTLSEDWQIDYESYEWKKLDPNAPETKTLVDEYFKWDGNFGGKKFNQGKIFK
ncbi:elongation factor 1 gamma, putative [Ixodes scapularis]|uniref:Elongation factor 1 gamma, putative n=1 Tax=Ixodes scapularis TaxID=6945 RepID=B7Q1W5_IXOSC|nr:elongation factor 1 gamma, putative [Ixodes scapularis]|eukprot:XP_002410199.1 elongation factor 1 gamma, putative [Ixodes scapularis]